MKSTNAQSTRPPAGGARAIDQLETQAAYTAGAMSGPRGAATKPRPASSVEAGVTDVVSVMTIAHSATIFRKPAARVFGSRDCSLCPRHRIHVLSADPELPVQMRSLREPGSAHPRECLAGLHRITQLRIDGG